LLGDLGRLDGACRLILLDPRGSGRSDPPLDPDGYRLVDFAADLELVQDHIEAPRAAVLGHSAGAAIALAYAASYRERVTRLILVGAFARFAAEHEAIAAEMRAAHSHEPWYAEAVAAGEAIAAATPDLSPTEFGDLLARGAGFCFARYGPHQTAHGALLREEGVNPRAWLAWDENTDLRPLLPHIDAPTLVLTGEQDCLVPPAAAREVAAGLPRGQLIVLPDAGHYPFIDQPTRFRAAVTAFLEDPDPP
jgi:pimeloyl-ACP methyl ester carboxylesterase